MKRIILMMLGLLVVSMFLIGCSQENIEVVDTDGNLVGEAFKYSGKYRVQLKQPMVQKQTCDDLNCKLNKQEVYLYGENDLFSGLSWSTLSTGAGMIKNSGKSGSGSNGTNPKKARPVDKAYLASNTGKLMVALVPIQVLPVCQR